MNTIITTSGAVYVVSLEEFINVLQHDTVNNSVYQYNAQQTPSSSMDSDNHDTLYSRNAIPLREANRANFIEEILSQTKFFIPTQTDDSTWTSKVEAAALESMENFGNPTHLVEVVRNVYGLFCKEDFAVKISSPLRVGLVCYRNNCNLLLQK
jgi:hypothetical protein